MLNFFQLRGQGIGFMCHILGICEIGVLCSEWGLHFVERMKEIQKGLRGLPGFQYTYTKVYHVYHGGTHLVYLCIPNMKELENC